MDCVVGVETCSGLVRTSDPTHGSIPLAAAFRTAIAGLGGQAVVWLKADVARNFFTEVLGMVASGLFALPPLLTAPSTNSRGYRPVGCLSATYSLARVGVDGGLVSTASKVSRIFSMVNGRPHRRLFLAECASCAASCADKTAFA